MPALTSTTLVGMALLLGACYPVAFSSRVPSVSPGVLPLAESPQGQTEVLVLVLWQDETYRWSGGRTVRPSFLAPPLVIELSELAQLDRIARKYRNYGVVAWDQHGGTVVQDKEPSSLYVIGQAGRIEWLVSERAVTDRRRGWRRHAWADLGDGWRSRLEEALGTCEQLVGAGGPCGLAGTPFAAALGDSDLGLAISRPAKSIEPALRFLSQVSGSGELGGSEPARWRFVGDGGRG